MVAPSLLRSMSASARNRTTALNLGWEKITENGQSGLFVPTMVFGEFMSGENFDDSGIRFTGGRNGIGAKATNVFSKVFEAMAAWVSHGDPGRLCHWMAIGCLC
eukprot:Skav224079  [mRNA]  locus=scaffold942:148738:150495:+ [translate_table: standard]